MEAVFAPAGNRPKDNCTKTDLRVAKIEVKGEPEPTANHEKIIAKRSTTVAVLSVLLNLFFAFETTKTGVTKIR